jgi:hypothetical protein
MKNYKRFILILCIIVIQISHAFAQPNPCSPGCSLIANGNFEQPNVDSLSSQGLDSYGGTQYPAAGFPYNLGHVSCWEAFELSPHIWPNDTSSSLNHFSVFGSVFSVQNGNAFELSEKTAYTQEFCLDSGIQYKVRYNYLAYLPVGVTSDWEGWWTFNFTDNINYNIYTPSWNDDVISTYIIGNDIYNPTILSPPNYLSINWHYIESNPFTYRNQQYLILGPKINPALPSGAYGTGIFIDNISFIPYIEFEIDTLCGNPILYEISPLNLPTGYSISYQSVLSGNLSIVQTTGNSCIFSLDNFTYGQGSSIEIQYLLNYQACNDDNCSQSDTLSELLFPYQAMDANTFQIQEVSCYPNCDGIVQTSLNFGTPPYSYQWSNFTTTSSNTTACVGMNYVTITDNNACWITDSVLVTDTVQFEILGYEIGKCPCDMNSYAYIPIDSMQFGISPFSYNWFTNPTQNTDTLYLTGAGVYSGEVTDAAGCKDTIEFEARCLEFSYTSIQNASCPESCDGLVLGTNITGINPCSDCYQAVYYWSNGLLSYGGNVGGFCPGQYTVTVIDCSSNTVVDTVTIGYDYTPSLSISTNFVSCSDTCDGSIEATLYDVPFSQEYTFEIYNSSYSESQSSTNPLAEFDSLCIGNYLIIATALDGCSDTIEVIMQSEFYNTASFTTNSCSVSSSVSIDITTFGPNSPFTYHWSNGSTLQDVTVSSPGTYTLTTTDADTCVIIETFSLDSIPLSAAINPFHPTCASITNGQLEIIASGGMPPYSYAWSTGASTGSITGLAPGFYSVTSTDSYGCSTVNYITLSDHLYLEATSTSHPPTCPDANSNSDPGSIELTIQDGVPPYTFLWSNNETNQNLITSIPGYYSVTITDSGGCQIVLGDSIQDISLVVFIHDIGQGCSDTTSNLLENASATANILGGVGPYTYLWSNSSTGSHIQDLVDFSNYSVTVTDANGCTGIGTVEVKSEQSINLRNGWDIWSTYIDLESQSISVSNFFNANGLSSSIIIMKNSQGLPYWPLYNIDLIQEFTNGTAYNIKMPSTGNYSFKVTGSLICPEDFNLNINQGWSNIAYLRTSTSTPQFEFAPIVSSITIVRNYIGAVYWPQYNINTIGNLKPGEGYLVNMLTPTVLNYSPNTTNFGTKSVYPSEDLIPDNSDIITDNFMILGIPNESWITEPNFGEIIVVKGEKGQIVGRAYYFGEFTALCLYGDDSSTPLIKEGLADDESFTIEIYSQSNKIYQKADISLKSWEQGNGRFMHESMSVLKPDTKVEIDNSNKIIDLQVFPNPNVGDFKIEFYSKQEGMAKIRVIDKLGRALFISENKNISNGANYFDFALKNISSGTYFLELSIGNCQEIAIFSIVNK